MANQQQIKVNKTDIPYTSILLTYTLSIEYVTNKWRVTRIINVAHVHDDCRKNIGISLSLRAQKLNLSQANKKAFIKNVKTADWYA